MSTAKAPAAPSTRICEKIKAWVYEQSIDMMKLAKLYTVSFHMVNAV